MPVIRKAAIHDASAITQFNIDLAYETENIVLRPEVIRAGVRQLIKQPELGYYLVAELNQSLIGVLMVTTEWSDWRNGQFWWIQSVYVLPEFRRQGLYSRLYLEIKKQAAARKNVCGFRLYVEKQNFGAQSTYEKAGMNAKPYLIYEELRPDTNFIQR